MVNKNKVSEPFLATLVDIEKAMNMCGCLWMVIGGVAVSVIAKPRFTADLDLVILVNDDNVEKVLNALKKSSITPRINDVLGFAEKNRILLMTHNETKINIDISLGMLAFENNALKNRRTNKIGNISLYVPRPEDLIVFKAVAHRPKDVIDISEIVKYNRRLDVKYIKSVVKEFADVLEKPEIWADIEKIIEKE